MNRKLLVFIIVASFLFVASRMSVFTSMENLSHSRGTEWQEVDIEETEAIAATHAATAGAVHKIFWASFYSDMATSVFILDGVDTLWIARLDSMNTSEFLHITFPVPLVSTSGNAVSANIDTCREQGAACFGGFSDKII